MNPMHEVLTKLNNPFNLTPTEYKIFNLLSSADRYFSPDEIYNKCFKGYVPPSYNSLRVHLCALKKKTKHYCKIQPGIGEYKGYYKLYRIMQGIITHTKEKLMMDTNDQALDELFDYGAKNYRKKPVVIQALEWNGHNKDQIKQFCPQVQFWIDHQNDLCLVIDTLEGPLKAMKGDYIIKGIKGEFYPCKPDIFAATYEEVK